MKSVVPYATHDHQSLGWWRPRKCWVHTLWVSKNTLPVVIGLQELAELQPANLEFVGNHKPVHMSQRPSFLIRSSFLKLMVSRSQCWWDKSIVAHLRYRRKNKRTTVGSRLFLVGSSIFPSKLQKGSPQIYKHLVTSGFLREWFPVVELPHLGVLLPPTYTSIYRPISTCCSRDTSFCRSVLSMISQYIKCR